MTTITKQVLCSYKDELSDLIMNFDVVNGFGVCDDALSIEMEELLPETIEKIESIEMLWM